MYEVNIKAMPGNPAGQRVGDRSGKWYVYSQYIGSGSIIDRSGKKTIHKENLDYDDAFELMEKLSEKLNSD